MNILQFNVLLDQYLINAKYFKCTLITSMQSTHNNKEVFSSVYEWATYPYALCQEKLNAYSKSSTEKCTFLNDC